jgi:hypothetical protein
LCFSIFSKKMFEKKFSSACIVFLLLAGMLEYHEYESSDPLKNRLIISILKPQFVERHFLSFFLLHGTRSGSRASHLWSRCPTAWATAAAWPFSYHMREIFVKWMMGKGNDHKTHLKVEPLQRIFTALFCIYYYK